MTERLGLAVAASAALVPLVALGLNFTRFGIRTLPVLGTVSALTVVLTIGALIRRLRLDPNDRFVAPVLSWFARSLGTYFTRRRATGRQQTAFEVQNNRQRFLNLLLVGAVVVLLTSVAYAAVGPPIPSQDGTYSELYLLDGDGEELLGTGDQVGGSGSVPATIAVENHEDTSVKYTVVVQRQEVTVSDDRTTVQQTANIEAFERTLGNGETAHAERTFQSGGENTRVQVLLFRGDAPSNPTADDAYRVTRFWPAGNPAESGGN